MSYSYKNNLFLENIAADEYGWDYISNEENDDNKISEDLLGFRMDNLFENRKPSKLKSVHEERKSTWCKWYHAIIKVVETAINLIKYLNL